MIDVLDTIKQAYDKSTTQVDKIVLNGKEYRISNVEYYDDVYEEGNIFGTAIAKCLDFEIENIVVLEGQEIEYLTGIIVNGTTQWITLGNYIIQDVQPNDTTNIAKVTAMDYMLKTNIPYVSELSYADGTVTLTDVLQEACTKSGLTLAITSFTNSTFIVDSNQFAEGTLNRQVIQAVAQVSGTVAKIRNNQLYLINPNKTTTVSKVFTLNSYKEAEIKRATHPINLVSLGMADVEGENITLRDESSIIKNGENSLVINDNPFAYTQAKREQLITALFNAVKGFEYKSYSFKCQGLPYLETLDKIQFKDKEGNTYDSFIFKFNDKSPNGLESTIEAPSITKATVAYQNIPSALDIAKRTEIIVDKQNQTIQAVVEETNEIQEQVTDIITTQATLEGTEIKIDDAAEEPIIKLEVDGASEQETRSGKNILDINNTLLQNTKTTVDNNSLTVTADNNSIANVRIPISYKLNTKYTLSFKAQFLEGEDITNPFLYFRKDATNKDRVTLIKDNLKNSYVAEITEFLEEGYELWIYIKTTTNIEGTISILFEDMQLEEGTVATAYEQYGVSPSPEFPSEIQSVGDDVNLFDKNNSNIIRSKFLGDNGNLREGNDYAITDYIPVNANTNYISSGLSITGSNPSVVFYDSNKNFISGIKHSNKNPIVFTTPENCKYIRESFYLVDIDTFKINKGTVATAYSEYGKGTVEIKQSGKNLLDIADKETTNFRGATINITNGVITLNGTTTSQGTINIISSFQMQEDSEYTFSMDLSNTTTSTWVVLKESVDNSTWNTTTTEFNFGSTFKSSTVTMSKDKYYRLLISTNPEKVFENTTIKLQLEKGTVATEYEQYKENNYVIPLSQPLRSLPNGVKDTIEEDGIHRRVGSVVLDGSEDWRSNQSAENSIRFHFAAFPVSPKKSNVGLSNYFKVQEEEKHFGISMYSNSRTIFIWVENTLAGTISEFKTWLSTHNTEVLYELAEEVIEPFDEEQQAVIDSITTFEGTNYFTCDANMRITYVRNNGLSDMYETKQNATKRSAQLQIQIDEINSKVESVEDLTVGKSGTKSVILDNCAKGSLLKLQIKGNNEVFKHLYPSDTLYPSNTLYPYGDSRIKVKNNDGEKTYELGVMDVLRVNGNVYDEYILENGIAKVIRRINTNGTVKTVPTEEDIGEYSIDLAEGTNTIEIVNYSATMNVLYAIKSNFTEIFATKVEVRSEISQKADEINLKVEEKVNNEDFTGANIMLAINNDTSTAQINADKISLERKRD